MSNNQPTASGVSEEMLDIGEAALRNLYIAVVAEGSTPTLRAEARVVLDAAISAKPAQGGDDAMDKAFQNLEEDRNGLVDALFAVRDGKRPAPPQPIPTPDEALATALDGWDLTRLLNELSDPHGAENSPDALIMRRACNVIEALSRARPEEAKSAHSPATTCPWCIAGNKPGQDDMHLVGGNLTSPIFRKCLNPAKAHLPTRVDDKEIMDEFDKVAAFAEDPRGRAWAYLDQDSALAFGRALMERK